MIEYVRGSITGTVYSLGTYLESKGTSDLFERKSKHSIISSALSCCKSYILLYCPFQSKQRVFDFFSKDGRARVYYLLDV